MEAVFLSVPRPPPPIVFSFDLGSAFSSICCIPYFTKRNLQCRRILGERNLVRVRNIVVAAIFDFMTVEDWGE